jgi:hypothetical protein
MYTFILFAHLSKRLNHPSPGLIKVRLHPRFSQHLQTRKPTPIFINTNRHLSTQRTFISTNIYQQQQGISTHNVSALTMALSPAALGRIMAITRGNIGAFKQCVEVIEETQDVSMLDIIQGFTTNGCEMWLLFKDVCREDLDTTIKILKALQEEKNKDVSRADIQTALHNHDRDRFLRNMIATEQDGQKPVTDNATGSEEDKQANEVPLEPLFRAGTCCVHEQCDDGQGT